MLTDYFRGGNNECSLPFKQAAATGISFDLGEEDRAEVPLSSDYTRRKLNTAHHI
jgi:hypothetical protein